MSSIINELTENRSQKVCFAATCLTSRAYGDRDPAIISDNVKLAGSDLYLVTHISNRIGGEVHQGVTKTSPCAGTFTHWHKVVDVFQVIIAGHGRYRYIRCSNVTKSSNRRTV